MQFVSPDGSTRKLHIARLTPDRTPGYAFRSRVTRGVARLEISRSLLPSQIADRYNAAEDEITGVTMEGIQFLTNDKGERVAVQIDLRKHSDVWEDLYDSLTARKRSREPRESLDSVKERLIKRRKLNG